MGQSLVAAHTASKCFSSNACFHFVISISFFLIPLIPIPFAILVLFLFLFRVRYAVNTSTREKVALKIIDLSRFSVETIDIIKNEISILKMVSHPNCIRIIDVKDNVPYTGHFCDSCACTHFKHPNQSNDRNNAVNSSDSAVPLDNPAANDLMSDRSHPSHSHSPSPSHPSNPDEPVMCLNCNHDLSVHSLPESRPVMMIVQELAAGGELFGLLMHCGPFDEEFARLYFRQLIFGLDHCHELGVAHR